MFDKKHDYARNKRSRESIIYAGTTEIIQLKREDFASQEEFENWKRWSDEDYLNQSKADRPYWEKNLLMEDLSRFPLAEDPPEESGDGPGGERITAYAKRYLSTKQYCRLMLYARGLSMVEIAKLEGTTKQAIFKSIASARRKLIRILNKR